MCSLARILKSLVYWDSGRRYFRLYAKTRPTTIKQSVVEPSNIKIINVTNMVMILIVKQRRKAPYDWSVVRGSVIVKEWNLLYFLRREATYPISGNTL